MEFRIAPMYFVIINFLLLLFVNPSINESISLKLAADYSKTGLPIVLLFGLSIGTFFRHTYYSKLFKTVFYAMQIVNTGLLIYYIVAIQQQHL
jgi:hypothetical protein